MPHPHAVTPDQIRGPASPSPWAEKLFSPRRRASAGCRIKSGMTEE
ncbi:MAG: hypothetical protein ACT6RN_17120 [Agrobacterium sp.]